MGAPNMRGYLQLESDEAIGYVHFQFRKEDLSLPIDEFINRYVKPAFQQALMEHNYEKERTA